jgi:glycosyltransferase involved in cell wall biosynthesis
MKIGAINPAYSAQRTKAVKNNVTTQPLEQPSFPKDMSYISFKSGNPRHIAHVIAEEPLFGFSGGGVGTVSNDYNHLNYKDVDKIVKFLPMYNQEVVYKKDYDTKTHLEKDPIPQDVKVRTIPTGLPEGHPFKGQEGTPFITNQPINKTTNLVELLKEKKNDIFLLEEVKSDKMNWGLEENVPIKMYRAKKEGALLAKMDKQKLSKEVQDKLEFIFTFVDSTSSMSKPYADGQSYSTASGSELEKRFASGWKGQDYAKFDKALVELMPALKEKYNIDPRYILCSDGQTLFTMHYAAQKNAAKDPYWQDKFLGAVGHNMNSGYVQEMGARQAIVNLGATKEEIQKLVNSDKYIEALKLGREEDFLRETVLKNFYDPKTDLSAFAVPIHYAKKGYVPEITTVSEGYRAATIDNPYLTKQRNNFKELDAMGRYGAPLNPLTDPTVSGFTDAGLQASYKQDSKIKLANGSEVTVKKFEIFDQAKKHDLNHIREIKRKNKINLFERFDKKFIDSQFYNAGNDKVPAKWEKAGSGQMAILTGASSRNATVYGEISQDYIKKLAKGEDVKLIVSWGRGDFQKGIDTVIDSFEKYAHKDPNAVLILGGDMTNDKTPIEKFKSLMYKPELKGRMVFMDGWTPGKDFALAADAALLPSRFAPCELTDLEAKRYCCTPIVPNVQGMAQKNFDPSIEKEAKLMDGYKGKHEFYMSEQEAYNSANADAKKEFDKVKNKVVNDIKKSYKEKVGEDIPEELFESKLKNDEAYTTALRNLRDSVISDEMSECLERALIKDRNTDIAKTILKNQVDEDLSWWGNGWLNKTGESSAELYRKNHFFNTNGKNISNPDDVIKLDFSVVKEKANQTATKAEKSEVSFGKKISNFFCTKSGKLTAGIASAAAIAGIGYAILKSEKPEEKEEEHLSTIG